MKALHYCLRACCSLLLIVLGTITFAQNGDQILDGIGETGLIARYIFKGDTRDWSRNNLHASSSDSTVQFVNDRRFEKVLSLPGGSKAFVSVPGDVLKDMESFSISSWIQLRSNAPAQVLVGFGKGDNILFSVAPLQLAPAIELHKWVHFTIVADIASKTLQTYVNGKQVGEGKAIPAELQKFSEQEATESNIVFIGKSIHSGSGNLDALLHDFRIYRVPLITAQIAGIFNNAQRGMNDGVVNVRKEAEELPKFPAGHPQLYAAYLLKVEDVAVETSIGNLPRLPAYLKGTYKKGIKGPKVKVIWPADIDNSAVLQPGTYTVTGRIAGSGLQPKAVVTVKDNPVVKKPVAKLQPFHLQQVSLQTNSNGQTSKFIENRDKFITTLAKTDPNSFLFMFRHAFGQQQPEGAKPLGVWDSRDTKVRGQTTGHYLTAIAQAYAGSGYDKSLQANFAQKMDQLVEALYELAQLSGKPRENGGAAVADPAAIPPGPGKTGYDSDLSDNGIRTDYWNWGRGFISAYPPDQFIMLEQGAKYGGQPNQVWAPYYTLHKILAGLLDVYEVSGNKKALEVASGMGDWVYARLSKVSTDTLIKIWNTYIAGEYGGMNEVMARMYTITNKPEHLQTARLFDNIKLFYGDSRHSHGLAKNVDLFRGLHANQHIPQIVGSIEMYAVTQNPDYYQIADNFWYKAYNDYMYSIGGVAGARNPANAECFISQPGTIYENGFSAGGQNETCATYNMLKLTNQLFMFDQQAGYMDYYERALYNHILASVAENSAGNTYHVPLNPGAIKQFGNANMTGFTCCNGTALESNTKLQQAIYLKSTDNQSLYVNLFIPSTLNWTERNIQVEQQTSFPREDQTKLTVRGNGKFDLYVRVPGWATKGFMVKINGKTQQVKAQPGSYLKLSRTWKEGDTIELKMPFQFHLDPVMDQQNIASLFYGPVLLAAQEPEPRKDWRKITLNAKDISQSIKGDPRQLEFTIDGVAFKPFYESYGRHSVYLDVSLQ
jgi:DUF1680 family protein